MPLSTSLLLLGLEASPTTPPTDWASLQLVEQRVPLHLRAEGIPLTLKADRLLVRYSVKMVYQLTAGTRLDPVKLVLPGLPGGPAGRLVSGG